MNFLNEAVMLTLNLEENGNFPACGPIVNDMHSNFGGEIGGWTQKDTLPEGFLWLQPSTPSLQNH